MSFSPELPALSALLLGIALFVGLSNKRRPSVGVELFILALVGIQIVQILLDSSEVVLIWLFAFIPERYAFESWPVFSLPRLAAALWTPFTYSLLHGNALHVFGNGIALFIFGRAVAWRYGVSGFLKIFAASSATGAALHLVFYWGDSTPLIGASVGAFGIMGATFRFVPVADDRLKALFWPDRALRQLPLAGLREMVTRKRSLVYILVCLVIYPVGLGAMLAGTAGNVAVVAHTGGIAFGVLAIGYFERRRPAAPPESPADAAPRRESFGLKLLRVLAIVMMVLGIVMGVLGYYLPLLAP